MGTIEPAAHREPYGDEAFADTPFAFDPVTGQPVETPAAVVPPAIPAAAASDASPPADDDGSSDEGAGSGDTLDGVVSALTDALADLPAKVAEQIAAQAKPAAKTEAPSRIDAIMETLADESDAVQTAVRTALEQGARAEDVLSELQATAGETALVNEIAGLSRSYPGLTADDVNTVLTYTVELSKTNPALADGLSIEEIAARALTRTALDARRTKPAPAPSGKATSGKTPAAPATPSAKGKPAAAEIVGDATPGSPATEKWEPGAGNDFQDIARHITETAGDSLIIRK